MQLMRQKSTDLDLGTYDKVEIDDCAASSRDNVAKVDAARQDPSQL